MIAAIGQGHARQKIGVKKSGSDTKKSKNRGQIPISDLARTSMSQMPCITPRKRSQFVVDLVPRELDCEGRELEEAALGLSSLEAGQACADTDRLACVDGAGSNEEFDEKLFMKEVRAQKGKRSEVPRALTE